MLLLWLLIFLSIVPADMVVEPESHVHCQAGCS